MLRTNLDHLETEEALQEALATHENLMICCGRMGPMCLPVYASMDILRKDYPHVAFFDQDFDGSASTFIRTLPECTSFMGLPFTVYFKKGKVARATTSVQTADQIKAILDSEFADA